MVIGANSRPSSKISAASPNSNSAKQRIRETFQTLIPLNTKKKDMRTIDEITRDLERGRRPGTGPAEQVEFTGVEATQFNDWFGKSKKEREKEQAAERERQQRENERAALAPKPSAKSSARASMSSSASRPSKTQSVPTSAKRSVPEKSSTSTRPASKSTIPTRGIKRTASPDYARRSEKRRRASYDSEDEETAGGYIPGSISALFGRDLRKDRMRDLSDSEDEGSDDGPRDYAALMKEELMSAKIAKREDAIAEAEEKAREEEKRKKRLAKARAGQ